MFVAAVIACGVAVAALAWFASPGSILGERPATFGIFALLLFIGELRPVRWLRRREGGAFTASWTFACSLLLIAPPAGAILATALASFLADAINRRPVTKAAFNAGNLAISLGVGALVLSFAGNATLIASSTSLTRYVPVAVLALMALFVVNGALTSVVIALAQEIPVGPVVRHGVTLNISTDGMLLALSPIFVVVSERSLLLIPLLLLTAWAVYRSAELALERQHAALHDSLTDLPNRGAFNDHLEQALAEARRRGHRLAVVMLDLDGFKEVNDRLGHHVGDLVLREVAIRLNENLRATDIAGRLGGDEFAFMLSHADEEIGSEVVNRFREALTQPLMIENFPVRVDGSFGIALFPQHGDDVETLMSNADLAMYTAKQGHLGLQVYAPGRNVRSRGRLSLLGEIRNALEENHFELYYQPKVALRTGAIVGVEALVRWHHPVAGMIPPDEFMPLAEHTELMSPFTEYVLRAALFQCARWRDQGLIVPVAINGSARNLHDVRFPAAVRTALEESGVDGRLLELEITENTVMADPDRSAAVLHQLKELGLSVSIDDFGTGFSSLANLRDLPADRIKIDRSFVSGLGSSPGDARLVRSIIQLAGNLGLETVAEGVEDAETVAALIEMGNDVAQGYHLCRPLPAEKLETVLRAGHINVLPRPDAAEVLAAATANGALLAEVLG
jgi:diguanylate cyclase (GGDEF)-like protein